MNRRFPQQFTGLGMQRVGVGCKVTKQNCFGHTLLVGIDIQRPPDFPFGTVGPDGASVVAVQRVDGPVLATGENHFGGDHRLCSRARGSRKRKGPLQRQLIDIVPVQSAGFWLMS